MNKKKFIIIIAVCITVLVMMGIMLAFILTLTHEDEAEVDTEFTPNPTINITSEPTPTAVPTQIPIVENMLEHREAMVLATEKLSFGLASNGKLSYIGSNEGQAYCYEWSNIVKIAGNSMFTAGLTVEGKICFSGNDKISETVSGWEKIVDIAASDTVLYALTSDGKVYSTDKSADSECAVKSFSAGSDFLICVHPDGSLSGVGNVPDLNALLNVQPIAVACGSDFVIAIASDGTIHSTSNIEGVSSLKNIVRVFAYGDAFAAIDEASILYTNCSMVESEKEFQGLKCMENVEWFSSSKDHALIMFSDGSVEAFGDNTYLQCKTMDWKLLPYRTDQGYIYGLTVGSTTSDGELLATGDEITLPNGDKGIAIVFGDIDMDGDIDADDLILLKEYVAGSVSLSEAQKHAANVYHNSSDPMKIDKSDIIQLGYHLSGYTEIDQYAKDFRYSVNLAKYENINTDVVGYIKVDKTNIEGPLMYGDNFFYHTHNYAKTPTSRGSLYLYYERPVQNIVITGHNLRVAGIMLNQLHLIQDKYAKEYDKFENRVWYINLFGETHLWEVFSMYEEKPSSPQQSSQYYNCNYPNTMDMMNESEIEEWIEYQQVRSELNYQLNVTHNDRFITILTCADQHWESNQGGRIYFFLRRVDGH